MTPKAIERLLSLKCLMSIVYVSCNAKQLQSELPRFKHYDIKSVALVDLFPQTNHFEAVVELVKKEY
jgi:tRNA/tmRNA/rRNA uracil-C5-methylase (TrmA/RlmC/RlmD family)